MVGSVRKSIFNYEAKDFSSYFVDETDFAYPDDIYGFINNAPPFSSGSEPSEDSQACPCKTPCRPYGRCYRFRHLCFKIVRISFRVLLFMFIFALIFIGSYFCHSCPGQVFVPVFTIINGCTLSLFIMYSLFNYFTLDKEIRFFTDIRYKKRFKVLGDIISLFYFIWIIVGSISVFKFNKVVEVKDITSEYYCHPHIFFFTFWYLIVLYGIVGSILVIGICGICIKNTYTYAIATPSVTEVV
ncbi:uncharacterized protein LOC115218538 isoform X1 [Octopus sinensis]|uniref:Uncharacterized protein LOC115218538 isoform X1 n=1 Tax=Octopus sinensis TaxID=2607531 RepID=A0A6P7T0N6_9MOLL|nr:uncharacterized protein LOC115218538 isoform X1 [Octopus sinensis]